MAQVTFKIDGTTMTGIKLSEDDDFQTEDIIVSVPKGTAFSFTTYSLTSHLGEYYTIYAETSNEMLTFPDWKYGDGTNTWESGKPVTGDITFTGSGNC